MRFLGIVRMLEGEQVIPLMQTSRIGRKEAIEHKLEHFTLPQFPDQGTEIYTQEDFCEMSKYRMMSLIQAPSGNFYSFLHLAQSPMKIDPLTRADIPPEFREQ